MYTAKFNVNLPIILKEETNINTAQCNQTKMRFTEIV